MQGIRRRVVYVALFEGIAIAITSTSFAALTGSGMGHASVAAAGSSVVAVVWNFIYNALFERWEARQTKRGRGLVRRIAHALGFEGGLLVVLVPLIAWWLRISIGAAFAMNIGLVAFFLVYGYVFNLAFDALFGLPASALPASAGGSRPSA